MPRTKTIDLDYDELQEAERALTAAKSLPLGGKIAVAVQTNLHAVRQALQPLAEALKELDERHARRDARGEKIPAFRVEPNFERYRGAYDAETEYVIGDQVAHRFNLYELQAGEDEPGEPGKDVHWKPLGPQQARFYIEDPEAYLAEQKEVRAERVAVPVRTVPEALLDQMEAKHGKPVLSGDAVWLPMLEDA